MGAVAHALLVCKRGRQQGVQDTRRVPERGACAQLGLHPLQLRRAAGAQQRADRREQHRPRHGRRQAAAAQLEPRRLELNRAEQGLQPTRAPVLERLQCPAFHAGPVMGRILRHLTAQHARLQLGQQRLGLGQHKADLRQRADHRRTADRRQLRRRHLARAVLASSRTVHCIKPAPRGQASARPIRPRRASHLPQVFDTPSKLLTGFKMRASFRMSSEGGGRAAHYRRALARASAVLNALVGSRLSPYRLLKLVEVYA